MPACYLKCGPGTSSISITWELVTLRPPPQTYWTRTCIFIICLVIPVHIRVWKILLLGRRRQWHPTPVLLPGKSHGQRSLVGCSPWGRWGSGTTERLHFHFSLSCIGEGNGNPLQCSCLENPRDGGAWWAVVYGVTQNQTWLKWLSKAKLLGTLGTKNLT